MGQPELIKTAADADQEAIDSMVKQFDELDKVVDRMHPKYKDYEVLQSNAQTEFKMMNEYFHQIPGQPAKNFVMFQKGAKKLQELYVKAVKIRAEMAYDMLRNTMNIDPKVSSVEADLENQLEKAFAPLQTKQTTEIRKSLKEICKNISISPAQMFEDAGKGMKGATGYYSVNAGSQIVPNIGAVDRDIQSLNDTEKTLRDLLGDSKDSHATIIFQFIDKLRTGLQQIRMVDPQTAAVQDWMKKYEVHHDWKPLRIALILFGGLWSVMGLGIALKGKGFSPATGLWMAVTILAIRPDLLEGSDKKALTSIQEIEHEKIHYFLTEKDWKGKEGRKAFIDIQAAKKEQAKLYSSLTSSGGGVNVGQIDQLIPKGSAASKLLKSDKMSDVDRAEALKLFGKDYDAGQKEMIETTLKWGEEEAGKSGI